MILRKKGGVGDEAPKQNVGDEAPKQNVGAGGKAPSLGCFCAYIGGCRGISAPFILPTQNHCLVVLRDYLILIYLVLWFFTPFWVIFDVKTAEIGMELSPTFTESLYKSSK